MFKEYGKNKQVKFDNENEYYQALGYLAQPKNQISFHREENQNQGAYTYEVRAHVNTETPNIPGSFKLTKGRPGLNYRINCNPYFEEIINNHNFQLGEIQDIVKIKSTIPEKFKKDFDDGYSR